MNRYAFWPNGMFCPLEDVDKYRGLVSDDYIVKDFATDEAALDYIDRVAFNNQFSRIYD
jgi:hypothetical protein